MRVYFLSPHLGSMLEVSRVLDAKPPRLKIEFDAGCEIKKEGESNRLRPVIFGRSRVPRPPELCPRRRVTVADEQFGPDLWVQTAVFCSGRLRGCMSLPPGIAEFYPIDDTSSVESFRKKEFMMMEVLHYEDFIDLEASSGIVKSDVDGFGNHTPGKIINVRNIKVRSGFVTDAPLFQSPYAAGARTFATEEFARKLLREGLEGVSFTDAESRQPLTLEGS